jgi:DNA-binding CsgD family transcriptional regulator
VRVEVGILGRNRELRAIDELVGRVKVGGGALLIRGDAGIGKSALLGQAIERGQAAGLRVLRAVGVRTEAHLPFAGLHQLLRPIIGGLDELPEPQRLALAGAFGLAAGTADDPFLVALATLTLLTDSAAASPILVVADDVQWLDRPSQDALSFVARRLGADPLVMLLAVRDEAASSIEAAGIDELTLSPLTEVDARQVVDARAPDLQAAVRDRIVREAAGNPLALVELSSSLHADPGTGDVSPEILPLSDRLERAFAARTRDLPEDTWWLLLVAAHDDRDGIEEMLAAAGVARPALTPAIDAGLVEADGSSLRFRHPLIRSAIQQRASKDERHRAHAALAGVVGDFDRAAWHRAGAVDAPDESVATLLDAAADRAIRRGAFVVALDALQRAATLSEDGRARGTRLLRAADVANDIGRMDVIGDMLANSEPIDVPALEDRRRAWITALALTGPRSPREAANLRSVIAAAIRTGEDGQPDLGLALLQFASARSWWLDPGVEIRSQIADAAVRLAPQPDDARAIFIRTIAPEVDLDELLASLARHASAAEPIPGIEARRLATAALWVGALDLSVDFFTESIAGLRREGRLGLLARSLIVRALASVHVGTLSTVASDLDEGFRLGVETRQPFYLATANVTQAIFLAYRGDIDGAEARIGEVERIVVGAHADGVLAETRHARGIIDLAAGRLEEAYEQLRHLFDPVHPSYHATVGGWAISDFAFAAAGSDRAAEATQVLARVEADAVRMKMPWRRIGMAYARAVLAPESGEPAAAAAFAAANAMDLERWPLARARLSLCHGVWLRRRRRIAESRAALRDARDVFDAIGIRYLADRARQELTASGEASQRHEGIDALDELTPQELQIARLAAEGLSNREIGSRLYLSHRTVGSHLYRAYPKLGITSRSQLHLALR